MHKSITTLFEEGHQPILNIAAHGRKLILNWPVSEEDSNPVIEDILAANGPQRFTEAYLRACDKRGLDPRLDDAKFAYLHQAAGTAPTPAEPIMLYRYMHEEGFDLLTFEREEIYHFLMGMLATKAQMWMRENITPEDLLEILKEILK